MEKEIEKKKRGRPKGSKNSKKTRARALKPIDPKPVGYKRGRPSKYKPEYCDLLDEMFRNPQPDENGKVNLPTLEGFCQTIGVYADIITDWCKKYEDFSKAVKRAKEIQKQNIIEGAITNRYNTAFSIFMMKNVHGWADKIEQKTEMDVKVKTVSELVGQIE